MTDEPRAQELAEQAALDTGSSSGIGEEVARRLAAGGAAATLAFIRTKYHTGHVVLVGGGMALVA